MANKARTKAEALLNLKYYIRLHHLHCRLYRRLRAVIGFFSLSAGSAAILSVVQTMPHVVATMGILVAALTYIDVLTNLSGKAALHGEWSRRFSNIKTRSAALNLTELDAAMDEVLADTDEGIESLRAVAWNDVLRSNGHEDGMRPETRSQKFARVFA